MRGVKRIDFKTYAESLGAEVDLTDVFKKLGYFEDEIFRDVVVNHPLTTLKFDYGLIRYGEDRYGMVACLGDLKEDELRKVEGICKLVGAKYGILTDLKGMIVVGEDGAFLEGIPNRDELRIELGLVDAHALAMSYDDFESVSDVDFIVENSRYVYSDMDEDRVIIFLPNRKLIEWLKERGVKFEFLDEREAGRVVDKFIL